MKKTPHEKALSHYHRAVGKVNARVRRKRGNVWLWLNPLTRFSASFRETTTTVVFLLVSVWFANWAAFAWIDPAREWHPVTIFLSGLAGGVLGCVTRTMVSKAINERLPLPANEKDVKAMVAAIRNYPVLLEKLESWVKASGASILTRSQCEFLTEKSLELAKLEQREKERLAGLRVLEEAYGYIGTTQSALKGNLLERAWKNSSLKESSKRSRL